MIARSNLLSLLKSPLDTNTGAEPVANLVSGPHAFAHVFIEAVVLSNITEDQITVHFDILTKMI